MFNSLNASSLSALLDIALFSILGEGTVVNSDFKAGILFRD